MEHFATNQRGDESAHYRRVPLNFDIRAQSAQFLHMHETVLEDCFGYCRRALSHTVERHELRLHVGWESRVWRSTQTYRLQGPIGRQVYPVLSVLYMRTRFLQLADYGVQNV